jgi:Lon protease-like protein
MPADQMPLQPPYRLDDCGWVANRWCELLPMPLEHKQRLMELDNPLVRLELVGDLLARSGIAT